MTYTLKYIEDDGNMTVAKDKLTEQAACGIVESKGFDKDVLNEIKPGFALRVSPFAVLYKNEV